MKTDRYLKVTCLHFGKFNVDHLPRARILQGLLLDDHLGSKG